MTLRCPLKTLQKCEIALEKLKNDMAVVRISLCPRSFTKTTLCCSFKTCCNKRSHTGAALCRFWFPPPPPPPAFEPTRGFPRTEPEPEPEPRRCESTKRKHCLVLMNPVVLVMNVGP